MSSKSRSMLGAGAILNTIICIFNLIIGVVSVSFNAYNTGIYCTLLAIVSMLMAILCTIWRNNQ